MTVDDLRALLAGLAPGATFTLAGDALGIEAVEDLFNKTLPLSRLTVAQARPDTANLSVSGVISLSNVTNAPVIVSFAADNTQKHVTGLRIDITVPGWSIATGFLNLTLDFLHAFGFPALHLLFSAEPDDAGNTAARVGIGSTLEFVAGDGRKTLTFTGFTDPAAPDADITLEADLRNVSLNDLAGLGQLVAGVDFNIPAGIPLADAIDLTMLRVIVSPSLSAIVLAAIQVQSALPWSIIPGRFEFDSLGVSFTILFPTTSPRLTACVTAVLKVGQIEVATSVSIPDLVLDAELQDVAPLAPFIDQYLPGVQIDTLDIDQFKLSLNITTQEYFGAIDINGSWKLAAGVELRDVYLTISGQRTSATGMMTATFNLGGTDVLIGGAYDGPDQGWTFTGSTVGHSQIPIGNLLDGAVGQFGVTLPDPISELELKDILLTLTTGGGNGANRKFSFTCEATTSMAGVEVHFSPAISLTYNTASRGWDGQYGGSLVLDAPGDAGATKALTFTVTFSKTAADKAISATYQGVLEFEDFAAALGFASFPTIPSGLDLALVEAAFSYDFGTRAMVLEAKSQNYGQAIFVSTTNVSALFAFGVDIHLGITLAELPLVGSKLPDAEDLGIDDLKVWVLSRPLTKSDAEAVNALLLTTKYSPLPDNDINNYVLLDGDLRLGDASSVPLSVGIGAADTKAPQTLAAGSPAALIPATAAAAASGTAPDDGTKWFNVQRQIGIFQFNRIGIGYKSGELRFALDAGVALGPFALSMDGLSISSPLTEFSPSFDISGLGLAYNSGPVEIAGALIKLPGSQLAPDVKFQFDGTIIVKAATFGISGIGSYAQLTLGAPSLFIFAQLDLPLGGPPPFFVTGLMAGFGFNRSLTIPEQDEVQEFPLLLLGKPPPPNQPAPTPTYVLQVLEGETAPAGFTAKQWIAPQPGALWFAIGINFTSFEIVQSKALLVIEPVGDFTLALLGLSTLQLPLPAESSESYAYVELQLRAVFQPMDGVFSASAFLSNNSFVMTPACHLTGGFAFSLWFGSNPHAGDFVITLGGYHPAFLPPAHYPAVPRLGFNWAVSNDVTIKGDAYFALTPSCAMAGGGLEVMFHDGSLSAWFTAQADMLVSWRPFFYVASIDVSIGISYGLGSSSCQSALSISIAASVDLWGPPTGGRAQVHLVIVTFTVAFGADAAGQDQNPLDWAGMKSLLPDPKNMCTVTASAAVAGMVDDSASSSGKRWVVRPRGFSFDTASAIPASKLAIEPPPQRAAALAAANSAATSPVAAAVMADPSISIRPMNKSNVASTHRVKVSRDKKDSPAIDLTNWTFTPRTRNMPEALWSPPPQPFSQIPATPSAKTIPGLMVGYSVSVPDPKLAAACGPIRLTELMEEYLSPPGEAPLSPAVVPDAGFLPSASTTTIEAIAALMTPTSVTSRTTLFGLLAQSGIYKGKNEPLTNMAAEAAHLFSDVPMQQA